MKQYLVLIVAILLSGCATTPLNSPLYQDVKESIPRVESGKSRLTFFRPAEGKELRLADAYISIDGIAIESITYGSFVNTDISTGKHKASVKSFGAPTCNLDFEASSEDGIFFEIMPRASISKGWFIFGVLGAIVGSAVESAGKECGGDFAVRKVDAEYAINKLATIRQHEK